MNNDKILYGLAKAKQLFAVDCAVLWNHLRFKECFHINRYEMQVV